MRGDHGNHEATRQRMGKVAKLGGDRRHAVRTRPAEFAKATPNGWKDSTRPPTIGSGGQDRHERRWINGEIGCSAGLFLYGATFRHETGGPKPPFTDLSDTRRATQSALHLINAHADGMRHQHGNAARASFGVVGA